jgi:hypothetical protein
MLTAPTLSFDLSAALVVAVGEALLFAIEQLKRRAATGIHHVIVTYEAGYTGFWLARLLRRHAIEV